MKNRASKYSFMRDFDHFCAQFSCVNHIQNKRCENRAFHVKIMRDLCI